MPRTIPKTPAEAELYRYKRSDLKAGFVWAASWKPEGGETRRRYSLGTTDRETAKRLLIDFRKLHKGKLVTVDDVMMAYLKDKESTSNFVQDDKVRYIANPQKSFGHLRPDQITRQLCNDYATMRRFKVKNGTIGKELATIRAACRWHNPNTKAAFKIPPPDKPRDRHLTKEQFREVLKGAVAYHIRLLLILGISTGARSSALLDLTWSRVDFDQGIIRFPLDDDDIGYNADKRYKPRAIVPITPQAREALLDAKQASLTPYVIEYKGGRIASAKKGLASAGKRAGIAKVSAHVLRHSAARWMAEGGERMSVIAQFLGHKNSLITEQVYARFSPNFLKGAAGHLEF